MDLYAEQELAGPEDLSADAARDLGAGELDALGPIVRRFRTSVGAALVLCNCAIVRDSVAVGEYALDPVGPVDVPAWCIAPRPRAGACLASAMTEDTHGFHFERRHLALACADVGCFELDAEAGTIKLDRRAAELVGIETGGQVGLDDYLARLEPLDRDRVARRVATAVASSGDAYQDEFRTQARRWIAADGRVAHDSTQRRMVLVGLLRDVTLRRTTEDERARLVDEMARTMRFNDMLVGMVAHDLRGPLSAVLIAAQGVGAHVQDDGVQRNVARIEQSTGRMSRIVEQLVDLTHARLDGQIPFRFRQSDLATIARQVSAETMAAHAGAVIAVAASADTHCNCDPERIAQVVSNLVANAVLHGTDVRAVGVTVDGGGPDVVRLTVANPGRIAPETLPTLFNPFRRVRLDQPAGGRSQGLGLGLYIARRIVVGHGGQITVITAEAQGTVFCVELPRQAASATFSLTPDAGEEEAISLQRLGVADQPSRVTASLFGVLPLHERAPDAFASLVERHARLLDVSLDRQIYRGAGKSLATDLRSLADQLGTLAAGAADVAELHSRALQAALRGAPAQKTTTLVAEGRLIALELMGRLLTFYRKRAGLGALPTGSPGRGA